MARRTERTDSPANPRPAKRGEACPICSTAAVEAYWPFCSRRCADVDLARWFGGTYAIPVAKDDDENGGDGAPEPPNGGDDLD